MALIDSADSSLQVGPPRQAASPQPTRPSRVSIRTKTKFTAVSVVNDMWCGRLTGMSATISRTSPMVSGPAVTRARSLGVGAAIVVGRAPGGEATGIEQR